MVAIAEDVVVKLTAEISGFNKGMEKSSAALGRFEANFNRSMANVRRGLAAVGAGLVVRQYVQLADASTNLAARISLVAGSGENAVRVQKQLLDIANRTRVGFEGVVTLYTRLGRSADELGVSQERLLRFTETLSQAMKISGATNAEASATVIQLSQALASGQLRGAELNSVLEQGGRVATALAEGLGVPIGALKKLGEEGKLTAQTVIGAIESQSETIQREFDRMPSTVSDSLTVMQNKLLDFVGRVDKSSEASRQMAKAVKDLSETLDNPEVAAAFSAAISGLVSLFNEFLKAATGVYGMMRDLGNLANELTGREWVNPALTSEQRHARAKHARKSGFVLPGVEFPPGGNGGGLGGLDLGRDRAAEGLKRLREANERYVESLMFERDIMGLSAVDQEVQIALRNLNSQATDGQVTATEALTRLLFEHKEKMRELADIENFAGEIKREYGDETEKLAAFVEQLNAAFAKGKITIVEYKKALADATKSKAAREMEEDWRAIGEQAKFGLADALVDIAMRTEDARAAMARFVEEIGRAVAKMLLLKGIEAGVDAIFGGSAGGKALGGLVNAGNRYLVGESGPELFVPRVSGQIIPSNRLGAGGSYAFNFTINAPGADAGTIARMELMLQHAKAEILRVMPKFVDEQRARGKMLK